MSTKEELQYGKTSSSSQYHIRLPGRKHQGGGWRGYRKKGEKYTWFCGQGYKGEQECDPPPDDTKYCTTCYAIAIDKGYTPGEEINMAEQEAKDATEMIPAVESCAIRTGDDEWVVFENGERSGKIEGDRELVERIVSG